MASTHKTITLSEQQDAWINARVASGEFADDSDYIQMLIRRDQEQSAQFLALKQAIQEGLDSPPSESTIAEIWNEAERRSLAEGG